MKHFLLLIVLSWLTICQSRFPYSVPRVKIRRLGSVAGTHETFWMTGESVEVFRGIPFAEAPVGERRFTKTTPIDKWPKSLTIYNASEYAPACIQPYSNISQSEDCLYLNVWRPKRRQRKLPVIVMIYGGAFVVGHSKSPNYSGLPLSALHDVIVVNFNYRLGAFGFADLSEISDLDGNQGLHDQRLALVWVKKHIEDFGGDPDNITLMGCSAGAIAVSYHLQSQNSNRLFSKAVMDAGVLSSRCFESSRASLRRMIRLSVKAGCNSTTPNGWLRCLRKLSPVKIRDVSLTVTESPLLGFRPTAFSAGERLVPVPKRVSVLLGHSGNEGLSLVSNGFGINDPLPELRNTDAAVEWCKTLLVSAFADERKAGIEVRWPTIERILKSVYFGSCQQENVLDQTALFVGDIFFHCPLLKFYELLSNSTFYVFERAFEKNVAWDVNPQIYKSFHMTAHMHFVGAQLVTLQDEIHPQDRSFTLRSMTWLVEFVKRSSITDVSKTNYPTVVTINNSQLNQLKRHEALARCHKLEELFTLIDG